MNDLVLLNLRIQINANLRESDKNNTFELCKNLLNFSFEKGLLLKNPFDNNNNLDLDTIIKESDLTEKGKLIFDDLAEKWFNYTDKTNKIDNISMLEKWLSKMSSTP